jgi:hypothetical protein
MCILPPQPSHDSLAATLCGRQRLRRALQALAGVPVRQIATDNHVSRPFVYRLRQRAHQALQQAFDPPDQPQQLLFWLPLTKPWLQQLVLGLVLICHSSYRGVGELLSDLFDCHLSLGSVHNLLRSAAASAEHINVARDLSRVHTGAHDEIFQAGRPVLVGADVHSSYCYLLSAEGHRDADTWGVRLLELQARGFAPQATIADFGSGLRAGQQQALPQVPCHADLFHPLRDFQALATYLDNRAYQALSGHDRLLRQQAGHEHRHGRKDRPLGAKAAAAGRAAEQAVTLADEVRTLLAWWRADVLSVAGEDYATRRELSGWIVAELRAREGHCPHRIGPVRRLLENHVEALLAFARQVDADLARLAERYQVSPSWVREALAVQQLEAWRPERWQREQALWRRMGGRYAGLREAVEELASGVVRASSVIENLNSRLRNYFFLRKQLGGGYLQLLQFFLNHRRLLRSRQGGRQEKSAWQRLSGQEHGHWLELLGYQRFRRAA